MAGRSRTERFLTRGGTPWCTRCCEKKNSKRFNHSKLIFPPLEPLLAFDVGMGRSRRRPSTSRTGISRLPNLGTAPALPSKTASVTIRVSFHSKMSVPRHIWDGSYLGNIHPWDGGTMTKRMRGRSNGVLRSIVFRQHRGMEEQIWSFKS